MTILASMGLRGRRYLSDAMYRELFEKVQEGFFIGGVVRDRTGRAVDFRFLEINDAFLHQTGLTEIAVLGLRACEAICGFPPELVQAFARVVDSGEPTTLELQVPALANRWYGVRAYAVGEQRFMALLFDISRRKRTEQALKKSEALLADIVESVDQLIWSTRPDGYHDFFNRRFYDYTGTAVGSDDGDEWARLFHPDDRERMFERWHHSLATGELYEIEYRLWHAESHDYRWVLGRAHPVSDEAGEIIRWMGTCTDIHEQKELSDRLELSTNELSHRIKNIFAVISALITLSVREQPEAKAFAEELRQRIEALGMAHDYARPHGTTSAPTAGAATVLGLIRQLLKPYEIEGRDRIVVEGDDGTLSHHASTPLSLAVHELATNAAKHGAFSTAEGKVHVEGKLTGETYHLRWSERGGPGVQEPERFGFGNRLVEVSLRNNLGGELVREWQPEGLVVSLTAPAESIITES